MSSDSPKDVVSGKILIFGNILGFPGVNWAQKWTKTENFGYVPFVLKHLILKHCSHIVFIQSLVQFLTNSSHIWGERAKKGPKRAQNGCCIATKTFENL